MNELVNFTINKNNKGVIGSWECYKSNLPDCLKEALNNTNSFNKSPIINNNDDIEEANVRKSLDEINSILNNKSILNQDLINKFDKSSMVLISINYILNEIKNCFNICETILIEEALECYLVLKQQL